MDAQARFDEIADELAARDPAVALGQMFGMPCVKRNGKAGVGFYKGEMVFKLPDEVQRERALALKGAKLFDPMGGRPMREWVQVPATHADEWADSPRSQPRRSRSLRHAERTTAPARR